ncbi:hypothetical protein [Mariprofundus ferrooxydans]|uniref:STAND family AAA ATPase n=1 Tax=Mariprofundus ferrooxydans TaxID=314344 RepID=UPI001E3EF0EC|nr:hypothetical protein [Mariprofundus ferrooxydans]
MGIQTFFYPSGFLNRTAVILFKDYYNKEQFPILLVGTDIIGKADIKKIVSANFDKQYNSTKDYWSIDKKSRILFIDDVDEWRANSDNFIAFIDSISEHFEYAILFVDKVSSLSDKSSEKNYFPNFQTYSISRLGHAKRDELIKKCIARDERTVFSVNNIEQVARLDKDTKHINSIIGANIVPSYPLFIVTIFHTVESATPQDLSHTSYGHCYHAMITMNLRRAGMKPGDINACFNFLTALAYSMFESNSKMIPDVEFSDFIKTYKEHFIIEDKAINSLFSANILLRKNGHCCFSYVYIYYYFVAKHLSDHSEESSELKQIEELISSIYTKDSANIIIFITHHASNQKLIDEILINAMSAFDGFKEATLSDDEKTFINDLAETLEQKALPEQGHSVESERENRLKRKDELNPVNEQLEEEGLIEDSSSPLLLEIRKSAKSMEIIGQILRNQYGSLKRDRLQEMFEEGQNVGLRLLTCFMEHMKRDDDELNNLIQSRLEAIAKLKKKELSQLEKEKLSRRIISQFSYTIMYSWMHKIVDSLGYDKLVSIADEVNKKVDTAASKLINLYIHTWHAKKLDINKIKQLHDEFKNDNNLQAIYLLKDIVAQHIYMHAIDDFRDKQKLSTLLGFSHQNQIIAQKTSS